jgi:hypothetical protein
MFEIEIKDVNEICFHMMNNIWEIVWLSHEVGIMLDWQQSQLNSHANF